MKKSLNEFYDDMPIGKDLFDYESLKSPPLSAMIPLEVDKEMYKIATSLSLGGKLKEKYKMMDDIMNKLDFTLLARGTNRSVYSCNYNGDIVVKIGYDRSGVTDAAREYQNQLLLKPFCSKCFDVSPSGAIGLFERVIPIKHQEEFASIAEDVFDILTKHILGRYILQDIGSDYYMNYGLRNGFGPVLLDYPYLYELDGKKLKCKNLNSITGLICDGSIDYDDGFNNLVCDKCGKIYTARELALEQIKEETITEVYTGITGGSKKMKLTSNGRNIFDSNKGGRLEQPKVQPKKKTDDIVERSSVVTVVQKPEKQIEVLTGYEITPVANNSTQIPAEIEDLISEAYKRGMLQGKSIAEENIRNRKQPESKVEVVVEPEKTVIPRKIETLEFSKPELKSTNIPKPDSVVSNLYTAVDPGFRKGFNSEKALEVPKPTATSQYPRRRNTGFFHTRKDSGLVVKTKEVKKPVKEEPKIFKQEELKFDQETYNKQLTRQITSTLIKYCSSLSINVDEHIYELIYVILYYHQNTDKNFKFDDDQIIQIAEKLTAFVEEELEKQGFVITTNSDGQDNDDLLDLPDPTDIVQAITDEQDDSSYASRTRDIDFGNNFNKPPEKDQAQIESEKIFKEALDNIGDKSVDPNDTSMSAELKQKIDEQLASK